VSQRRIPAQHFLKGLDISNDYGVCGTFELGACGVRLPEFVNVP
jgi:hypothetical protein